MTSQERRRSPRFDVSGVQGTFQFTLDMTVVNLSVSGMAVETNHRLTVGRRYLFKVYDGGIQVSLPGTVAWCVLGRTKRDEGGSVRPVYRAGIQFDEVLTEQARTLLDLIEAKAVIEPQARLFGRFAVRSGDAIHVDAREEFLVRRLSASGMLVEAPFVPEVGTTVAIDMELGGKRLAGSGRAVYVRPLADEGDEEEKAEIGLEFIELSPEGRRALESFISGRLAQG